MGVILTSGVAERPVVPGQGWQALRIAVGLRSYTACLVQLDRAMGAALRSSGLAVHSPPASPVSTFRI